MRNHPWMKLDLKKDNFFPEDSIKSKLFKYVSVRNEGRQKHDNQVDDDAWAATLMKLKPNLQVFYTKN